MRPAWYLSFRSSTLIQFIFAGAMWIHFLSCEAFLVLGPNQQEDLEPDPYDAPPISDPSDVAGPKARGDYRGLNQVVYRVVLGQSQSENWVLEIGYDQENTFDKEKKLELMIYRESDHWPGRKLSKDDVIADTRSQFQEPGVTWSLVAQQENKKRETTEEIYSLYRKIDSDDIAELSLEIKISPHRDWAVKPVQDPNKDPQGPKPKCKASLVELENSIIKFDPNDDLTCEVKKIP